MELPDQRSWGSVVQAFARHGDRKCTLDFEGRIVRRNVLVLKDHIQGIGKEANRIESARVRGVGPAGARAKVYYPLADRILPLPLSWAAEHGIDRRNFARLRKRLRTGKSARGYRGGLLERVQSFRLEITQPAQVLNPHDHPLLEQARRLSGEGSDGRSRTPSLNEDTREE